MKIECILFILLKIITDVLSASVSDAPATPIFRKDYTYIKEFDAFFKEHRIPQNWTEAVAYCSGEGAQLIIPGSKAELDAILGITRPESHYFWVGIHDLYAEGDFITLNGTSLEETYINWGPGEPNNVNNDEDCIIIGRNGLYNDIGCAAKQLFICKKLAAGLQQNEVCETYDTDYVYYLETDRCYKFHKIAMKWTNAFRICRSEESQLAVINSAHEAKIFTDFFARYPAASIKENIEKELIHMGFNDLISPGLFLTVDGKHISETGYDHWAPGQPDNRDGTEHCGSMFRDGSLNDGHCEHRAMFICEKALSVNGKLDIRHSMIPSKIQI